MSDSFQAKSYEDIRQNAGRVCGILDHAQYWLEYHNTKAIEAAENDDMFSVMYHLKRMPDFHGNTLDKITGFYKEEK